jgi:shikimate dehydrogenase
MSLQLNGATRLYPIIGAPIAQVKSPSGVSDTLQAAGLNALVLPMHVKADDFAACMRSLQTTGNVDGVIVTVPHKFAAATTCHTLSARAQFLGAVNTIRKNTDGSWHGDMFDGLGYVTALRKNGCEPSGKRVLLVGAGGAGSAIAHALIEAGVRELAIHDADDMRRNSLIQRLVGLKLASVIAGSRNPRGFDIVLNATPVGMSDKDSMPVDVSGFKPETFVGDVITAPAVTPMLQAAMALGCGTQTGADMFATVRDLMVAFFLETAIQQSLQ